MLEDEDRRPLHVAIICLNEATRILKKDILTSCKRVHIKKAIREYKALRAVKKLKKVLEAKLNG